MGKKYCVFIIKIIFTALDQYRIIMIVILKFFFFLIFLSIAELVSFEIFLYDEIMSEITTVICKKKVSGIHKRNR